MKKCPSTQNLLGNFSRDPFCFPISSVLVAASMSMGGSLRRRVPHASGAATQSRAFEREPTPAQDAMSSNPMRFMCSRIFLLLLFCDSARSDCLLRSDATCPLAESDPTETCFLKGYSHFWGFDASPFSKFDFPAKGLYTFAKVQKDTSDCCGDLEIEGFMCDILKNNTPVRAHHPCVTQAL